MIKERIIIEEFSRMLGTENVKTDEPYEPSCTITSDRRQCRLFSDSTFSGGRSGSACLCRKEPSLFYSWEMGSNLLVSDRDTGVLYFTIKTGIRSPYPGKKSEHRLVLFVSSLP